MAVVKFSAIDRLGNNDNLLAVVHHGKDVENWAIGIMNEGNVIADFDSDLYGDGSQANLKVVAASSAVKFKVWIRVTNYGCHSVGHIYNTVSFLNAEHDFNGVGTLQKC